MAAITGHSLWAPGKAPGSPGPQRGPQSGTTKGFGIPGPLSAPARWLTAVGLAVPQSPHQDNGLVGMNRYEEKALLQTLIQGTVPLPGGPENLGAKAWPGGKQSAEPSALCWPRCPQRAPHLLGLSLPPCVMVAGAFKLPSVISLTPRAGPVWVEEPPSPAEDSRLEAVSWACVGLWG